MTLFSLSTKQNAATASLLFTMMTSLLTFTQHNTQAFLLPSTSTTSIYTSTTTLKNGVTPHENELSRIFETDIFTSSAKTTTSRIRKNREIPFQVEATVNECEALCKRFKLPAIHKLKADLFLKKSDSNIMNGIQVKGQVESTLTQTCVRTNEDFQVDLDFDLFAIVKPMSSRGIGFDNEDEDENNDDELAAFLTSQIDTPSKTNKKRNNNNKGGGRRNTRNNQRNKRLTSSSKSSGEMSTIDMEELQNFFNDMEGDANNNNIMNSLEEDLIEDYAVYHDDVLDIGELVAQMFRMKLDPYPKKPGSQPIQMSITG